jgi:drug/metabolite transporter (DMT)-like permease
MSTTATRTSQEKSKLILLIAAFTAVYLIWGSTYLAIKYAIETIPSFLMAGMRFLTAGAVLYGIGRLSPGYERPKLIHWRTALIVGTLLLAMGNGGVVIAEHYIPSSLAALLIATEPFWIVVLGWMFMGKGRPNWKVATGLLLGFPGVWLLISGQATGAEAAEGSHQLFGAVLIIVASLAWAAGSLYGSSAPTSKSVILASGMQMLSGGAVTLIIGTVTGEWSRFDPAAVSGRSWLALAYLVVFGALIAYTAYSWLLKNASPTSVATYAYVNPAVAVVLGWAIAGESMTGQMLVGAAFIVGSVAMITMQKKAAKEIDRSVEPAPEAGPARVRENYSTS